MDGFQNDLAHLFSVISRSAIWRFHLDRSKVKVTWAQLDLPGQPSSFSHAQWAQWKGGLLYLPNSIDPGGLVQFTPADFGWTFSVLLNFLSVQGPVYLVINLTVNSYVLMTTQEAFVDSVDQRSDCTECAAWSLIYTVHIFILDCSWTVSSYFNVSVFLGNEKTTIYLFVSERLIRNVSYGSINVMVC